MLVTGTHSPPYGTRTVRDDDGRTVRDDDDRTVRIGAPRSTRQPTDRDDGDGYTLRDEDGNTLQDAIRRTHPDVPIIPVSRGNRPLPTEPSLGRSSPSIIEAVPPPGRTPSGRSRAGRSPPRTPHSPSFGDLALAEEERDRLARLDEVEHRLNDVAEGAREAEEHREAEFQDKERLREDEFRANEEDRQRIFRENEEVRAREAIEARDAILQDFPGGLGTAPTAPGGSVSGAPAPGGDLGDGASVHTAIQDIRDSASRHSQEIRDVIDMEREENAREREAATAERVRLEAERDAAVQAAQELKDSRIQELEEQVASLRAELEAEKQAREAEESDARERERAEREENNDFIRNQLMDLTNLMNEQRQATDEKRELMESRYAEKEERRRNKEAEKMEMREMLQKLFDEFQMEKDKAEALRLDAEGKPGMISLCFYIYSDADYYLGVEKILEEVMRRHDDIQESLRAFSDSKISFHYMSLLLCLFSYSMAQ